jgi:hypothetical protein
MFFGGTCSHSPFLEKRELGTFFGYKHLNWEALRAASCTRFFPLRRIIFLRIAILSFQQREKEPLGIAWDGFASMNESCPALNLPDLVLLQHFQFGLLRDSGMALDAMSGVAWFS